jgi:Flp pilus assembly protein TadD
MKRIIKESQVRLKFQNGSGSATTASADEDQDIDQALTLYRSGTFQDASSLYWKIIGWQPNSVTVLSNLASVLKHQGELDEAILLLKKALKLAPGIPELRNNQWNAYTD